MVKTIFTLLVLSGIGYAQTAGPPPPGPPPGPGGPPHTGFGPEGFGFGMRKVVTNAPYSADISDQSVQTLADGNRIQRSTTGHAARDSEGRSYLQQTITGGLFAQNGPKTVIFISDPIAGYSYVLDPATKIAVRRAIKVPTGSKSWAPEGRFPNENPRPDGASRVETDLGTQNINGISAQGKSVTHTIAAGAIGNAQAIVSTSETWYSPDLQIPVLAKRNDPRFGQSTYSATSIQRTEPPASLFQVPSEYTVQDAPAMHHDRGPAQ